MKKSYIDERTGINYTSNVMQSTTGNIYGVYDMRGGLWEQVAGYVDNGMYQMVFGSDLISADIKYRDVYTVASPENRETNYINSKGIKGDAVFETSESTASVKSWHYDFSDFPNLSAPWFIRRRRK